MYSPNTSEKTKFKRKAHLKEAMYVEQGYIFCLKEVWVAGGLK